MCSKRNGHDGIAAFTVLLVTKDERFAEAASEQLSGLQCTLGRLSPHDARQTDRFGELSPDIVFVDYDVTTPEGLPLHQFLKNASPDSEIVLICTVEQAAEGARAARLWEVFDYVLTDSVRDPHRVPLLVERAKNRCPPEQGEIDGEAKTQYRRILEALTELRTILKSSNESPIVKLIDAYRGREIPHALRYGPSGRELADAYHDCLVDLVCGRLKRLENAVFLSRSQTEPPSKGWNGGRILVVDDDTICLEIIKNILERNGYDVIVATTAEAAKNALVKHRPALVLMDIHLGEANGLQLVKGVRAGTMCPDVPVIVITGDRMKDTLLDAVDVRVQGYLLKPFQPSLLVAKVKSTLAQVELEALAQGN